MVKPKQILRKVVKTELYAMGGSRVARTRLVTLECGHVLRQKRSMRVPVAKICGYCKPEKATP